MTKTDEEIAQEALRRQEAPALWAIYDRRKQQLEAGTGCSSYDPGNLSTQDKRLLDELRQAVEYVAQRAEQTLEAPYSEREAAIAEAFADVHKVVGPLIKRRRLRSHPVVQEWLAALRTLEPAALRKYKNDRLGDLGRRPLEDGGYIRTWIIRNAQWRLDAGFGPEDVRLQLRRLAKEQWPEGKDDPFNEIRNGIMQALNTTRQGFHKRLRTLGLLPGRSKKLST